MPMSYRSKAFSGVKWTSIEQVLSIALSFVIGIIVARLVMPSDYGLIAMLGVFMALGGVFVNSGISTALVRHKHNSQADYSTAFYANVALGLVVYAILYVLAPLIAGFYEIPELTAVCRVYSLDILLSSLTIVHVAKLTHEMRYKVQTSIKLFSLMVSGVIGISLAYGGYGVWALIGYTLSASGLRTVLFWVLSGWYPSMVFSRSAAHYLYDFGSKMLLTSIIDVVYDNIYTFVIGKYYTATSAGYYNRSLQLSQFPQNMISHVVGNVVLPVLTPFQDNQEKLLNVYDRLFRLTVYVAYPLMALMVVLAYPLIDFLLGEKWLPSVPYLQILVVAVVFTTLTIVNLNLFFVKGRSDVVLKLDIYKKIIGFAMVAVMAPLGLKWICVGSVLYAIASFVINCTQTHQILGYGLWHQVKTAFPPMLYSVLMGLVVAVAISYVSSSFLQLVLGGLLGLLVYVGLSLLLKEPALAELMELIHRRNG